jgi:hypothetical protein
MRERRPLASGRLITKILQLNTAFSFPYGAFTRYQHARQTLRYEQPMNQHPSEDHLPLDPAG